MDAFRIRTYEEHGLKKWVGEKQENQPILIKTGISVPKPVTMAELVERCNNGFHWYNDLNDYTYYRIVITMSNDYYYFMNEIF